MARLFLLCILIAGTSAEPKGYFRVRNSVIEEQNDLGRLENVEPEDCAKRCDELENCNSFEYKAEHRKCDLSSALLEDNDLIKSIHGWEIYAKPPALEKAVAFNASERFFRVRNSVIEEKNDLGRLENVEPEECATKCLEMGLCQSFEYKAEHRKCDLSSARIEENNLIQSVYGWEIYARFPTPEGFFRVKNSVIEEQNDLGRLEKVEREDCAQKCLELENCHSFEYKDEHRKCDLSSARLEDNDLIQSVHGWEIYAMYPTPESSVTEKSNELERFFLVRNSVIEEKNDLGRLENVDPEDCARRCSELTNCSSFEYKAEHRKCEISSARLEENDLIRSVHGWEIYAKFPNSARISDLNRSIDIQTQEIADIQETMRLVQVEIETNERLLQNATDQVDALMDQGDQLRQDTDTLVALLQSSNETLSNIITSYEELVQDREDLVQTLAELQSQITELEASAQTKTDSVSDKHNLLKEMYDEKAQVEGELLEITDAVSLLESQVNSLNQQIEQLEGELDDSDEPEEYVARDCYELYTLYDVKDNGVYDIYPFGPSGKSVKAYCYMDDGGGWTVIQHRDTSKGCLQSFHKTWTEYKDGFGDPADEYWLGNDAISSLTIKRNEMKVYVRNSEGYLRYSHYRDFQMGKQSENYKLKSISYKTGNAGDQLSYLRNYSFGTRDKENNNGKCSSDQNGGFWFKTTRYCSKKSWWSCSRYSYSCSTTNINGKTPIWSYGTNWSTLRIRPQ